MQPISLQLALPFQLAVKAPEGSEGMLSAVNDNNLLLSNMHDQRCLCAGVLGLCILDAH